MNSTTIATNEPPAPAERIPASCCRPCTESPSLAKRWLLGTHQRSGDDAHLASNLNEFVFRFNRRRSRRSSIMHRDGSDGAAAPE